MTPKEFRALSIYAQAGLARVLASDCHVSAAFDPATTPAARQPTRQKFSAIWDTGASGSVITQNVVDACGLKPITFTKVYHGGGATDLAEVYLVNILLLNNVQIHTLARSCPSVSRPSEPLTTLLKPSSTGLLDQGRRARSAAVDAMNEVCA
jgi:hypothetical protein